MTSKTQNLGQVLAGVIALPIGVATLKPVIASVTDIFGVNVWSERSGVAK